jgi:hypothetical protein
MVTEYAQLLSTAHRLIDGVETVGKSATGRKSTEWKLNDSRDSTLYKATHRNHPSAVWCRASSENYKWLAEMLVALCKEYSHRYGKVMKIEREGLLDTLQQLPNGIKHGPFTQPTQAMPDEYKVVGNSIQAYQNYYKHGKKHLHFWKNRPTPPWIEV